jgi:hypothetical protein
VSLTAELASLQRSVPDCLAAGCVDLTTGMLLGLASERDHPVELLDLFTAAAGDVFLGPNLSEIEHYLKAQRGAPQDDHHYLREVIILSDNLTHVLLRRRRRQEIVLAIVCRSSANLGMILAKSRQALSRIESLS